MNCTFCDIVSGKVESNIIYKGEEVIAILDKYPISLGHTLILPKKHIERFKDVPEEMYLPLFKAIKKVNSILRVKLKAEGYNISINDGRVANQLIPHIHIHVIPRRSDDHVEFTRRLRVTREELKAMKDEILS